MHAALTPFSIAFAGAIVSSLFVASSAIAQSPPPTQAPPPVTGQGQDGEAPASTLEEIPDDEAVLVLRQTVRDNEMSLAIRGQLQTRFTMPFSRGRLSNRAGDLTDETSFQLRRVRVGIDATILPTVTAHVSSDVVDSLMPTSARSALFLANANIDLRLFQLRAGLLRVPFTRHGLVDETRQVFLEPPTAWRADRYGLGRGPVPSVLPDRRVGAELHEEIDGYAFSFGAFSGGGAGAPEPATTTILAGRIEVAPWGAVPAEGSFFRADYAYGAPRVSFAAGVLGRAGAAGNGRAASAAIATSYKGFYASVEAVLGSSRIDAYVHDDGTSRGRFTQRGLVVDVAYRFPVLAQGLELGVRGDVAQNSPAFDRSGDQRTLAGVANLYFWRHRMKASTLFRSVWAPLVAPAARTRHEGILELSVGF